LLSSTYSYLRAWDDFGGDFDFDLTGVDFLGLVDIYPGNYLNN